MKLILGTWSFSQEAVKKASDTLLSGRSTIENYFRNVYQRCFAFMEIFSIETGVYVSYLKDEYIN
jgi:hypothetical protein